jgi:hypothetical protein
MGELLALRTRFFFIAKKFNLAHAASVARDDCGY